MRKSSFVIAILIILLVVAVGYIVFSRWQEKQAALVQQAALFGYQQAIIELIQKAALCEQVPLYAGNQTLSVIAVECLQSAFAGNRS